MPVDFRNGSVRNSLNVERFDENMKKNRVGTPIEQCVSNNADVYINK